MARPAPGAYAPDSMLYALVLAYPLTCRQLNTIPFSFNINSTSDTERERETQNKRSQRFQSSSYINTLHTIPTDSSF